MLNLRKKLLVNGCGLTFGGQSVKSWPQILTAVGLDIVNLSAPAVSNQWIVDRTAEYLLTHDDVDIVIVQLTSVGKLDVEIVDDRQVELVETDSVRNFVWQGVWPSSSSSEHLSKQLYYKHLYSPTLLTKELAVKLSLLDYYCKQKSITLLVCQGYDILWTPDDLTLVANIIQNLDLSWGTEYRLSSYYREEDIVPCVHWFIEKALEISKKLELGVEEKIKKIQQFYS
jgi:hypothetical protein